MLEQLICYPSLINIASRPVLFAERCVFNMYKCNGIQFSRHCILSTGMSLILIIMFLTILVLIFRSRILKRVCNLAYRHGLYKNWRKRTLRI